MDPMIGGYPAPRQTDYGHIAAYIRLVCPGQRSTAPSGRLILTPVTRRKPA
jgi:hypothetical protein